MRAAWIAVGSELLGTERLDTNALLATALLRRHGVELRRKAVVGDRRGGPRRASCASLLGAYELVLVCGGLGPTADDVTREAVARACGRALVSSRRWSPTSRRSSVASAAACRRSTAARRSGSTAPSCSPTRAARRRASGWRSAARRSSCCPGRRASSRPMLGEQVEPWLAARTRRRAAPRRGAQGRLPARVGGGGAHRARPTPSSAASASPCSPSRARSASSSRAARRGGGARRPSCSAMRARLRELLGDAVFTDEASEELEAVVGRLLRAAGATVATGRVVHRRPGGGAAHRRAGEQRLRARRRRRLRQRGEAGAARRARASCCASTAR